MPAAGGKLSRGQPPKARQQTGGQWRLGPLATAGAVLSRHREIIRALVIYAWALTVLLLFYWWLDGTVFLQRFLDFNASATGFLARLFDSTATVSDNMVTSDGFAIIIVEECTSLAPLAIFVAAVLAVPSTISGKALGIVLGFVVLFTVNLVRTTSLFYIGSAYPSSMEVVHLLVWQSIMVAVAVSLWFLWMRRWAYDAAR